MIVFQKLRHRIIKHLTPILLIIFTTISCSEPSDQISVVNKNTTTNTTIDLEEQVDETSETHSENINPTDVSYDTNHVKTNTAGFKVTLLLKNHYFVFDSIYGPKEKKREDIPTIDFGESLMRKTHVIEMGNNLCFAGTILLTDSFASTAIPTGLQFSFKDTIPSIDFLDFHQSEKYRTEIGELTVGSEGQLCMDTGISRIQLRNKKGTLDFGQLNNLKIFEYDLNLDRKNELYIISYQTCQQNVAIYKVEN